MYNKLEQKVKIVKQNDWDILSDMTITERTQHASPVLKERSKKKLSGLPIKDRVRAVRLVNNCAFGVSVFYTIIYALMGMSSLALFNFGFCCVYGSFIVLELVQTRDPEVEKSTLQKWLPEKSPGNLRIIAVLGLFSALVQLSFTAAVFIPPAAGTHFYLVVIPIFALITIDPKDRIWWWFLTLASLFLIVFFEVVSDIYEPLVSLPLKEEDFGAWRGMALLFSTTLIIGVFRSFHESLEDTRKDLTRALQRSELLLLNTFPKSIARRLKKGKRKTIADNVEMASVLFADLVGFTELAGQLSAKETVKMLNGIFSAFDTVVVERGLEKIKTIGDAYMAASGIPEYRKDHGPALVGFALDMLELLEQYNEINGTHLKLRIGIHCGPLTAGVIGSQKFSYDIWGDTVNVASRMESTGEPGRIHVSETFARAAKRQVIFEERGMVKVKGKGDMRTFFVAQNKF